MTVSYYLPFYFSPYHEPVSNRVAQGPGLYITMLPPANQLIAIFSQCADRGTESTLPIPIGVVCYIRTTTRSEAVYIFKDSRHQDGAAT